MKLFTSDNTEQNGKKGAVGDPLISGTDNESGSISMTDINFGDFRPKLQGAEVSNDSDQKINAQEPDNFFFDMGQVTMLNGTTIYFNCFVEKNTVDDAIRLLKRVNQNISSIELDYPEIKGKMSVKFVINSGGGNVVQGLRLFDAIKNNVYPVTTIANGMAASMGIIILVAGKVVQATEHSVLMIHQLSAGAQGKFNELQGHMKFWTDLQSTLGSILVVNSKAKKEDIEQFMKGETYMLAPEAMKLGLIESIVSI